MWILFEHEILNIKWKAWIIYDSLQDIHNLIRDVMHNARPCNAAHARSKEIITNSVLETAKPRMAPRVVDCISYLSKLFPLPWICDFRVCLTRDRLRNSWCPWTLLYVCFWATSHRSSAPDKLSARLRGQPAQSLNLHAAMVAKAAREYRPRCHGDNR